MKRNLSFYEKLNRVITVFSANDRSDKVETPSETGQQSQNYTSVHSQIYNVVDGRKIHLLAQTLLS